MQKNYTKPYHSIFRYTAKHSRCFNIFVSPWMVKCRRVFPRAFFDDDEGCVDFRPHKNARRVRGYQKNKDLLYLVQKLLEAFSIRSTVTAPNEIVIVGKSNLAQFQKEINFSPGVRVNGNRANSIWKKSFEKRQLLTKALASYQQ